MSHNNYLIRESVAGLAASKPESEHMTTPKTDRVEESTDETNGDWPNIGRRPLMKAFGAAVALSAGSGAATATNDDDRAGQPEGFETEVVAPHATFPDDVATAFGVAYEDGAEDSAFLRDASTVVIVRASLAPGGTSGWHGDKGPVIGSVVEGEIDVTFEDQGECVTRTYAAGEALVATGEHADVVENASDSERAVAYLVFLGVPDGEPPSSPVEPPDC